MHTGTLIRETRVSCYHGKVWSSSATTRREFRPFPCSNAVPIEAKKSRLVLKSRLVVADEDGIGPFLGGNVFLQQQDQKVHKQ